ncbi:MAG TPA: DUF2911 domain-containing protein [Pyrinomonadaceae bacterium]|nr:DUF2911 domain-containing protein [Acidobacteriota bacterium]HMM78842.1 DUF2911 domain-containing protein [Pyrinomonadaceae bacterium]
MNKILLLRLVIFIIVGTLFTIPSIAQKEKIIGVDKDGEFHVSSPIRVGDRIVEKGMYQIYRVDINTTPFIVIRKVAMTYFGKTMGSMKRGDEVVRLKCTIQRVDEEYKKSKILLIQSVEKERLAVEARFRHDKSKCVLPRRGL